MNRTTALTAAALLALATGATAEEQAPPELKSLQTTYAEQKQKLAAAYTARLRTLRAEFEKAQKLYEATLVVEEIKRAASALPAEPPPRPPGLSTFAVGEVEIISAAWGIRSSVVDVTAKVVETLEAGEKVAVGYQNLGDPRPYSSKDLVVTYLHDGQLKVIGVGAGKSLSYEQLVAPPKNAAAPRVQIEGLVGN